MAQILSSLPPPQQLPSSSTSQNQAEEILSGQEGVGGDQSLTSPALRLISCSQGPNCRHISREVPGHFQKQFQENVQLLLSTLLFTSWG